MGAVGIPLAGSVIMVDGSAETGVAEVVSMGADGSAAPAVVGTESAGVLEAGVAAVDVSGAASCAVCCKVP